MLYELHRILTQEHKLLSSLQEKGGNDKELTVASKPVSLKGFWTELLEVFSPNKAKIIKKKIQAHMKKVERTKGVKTNNIEGYFKNMDLLKRDEITKALKGPTTNETITLIESKLEAETIETKQEAVKILGPIGALKLLVTSVIKKAFARGNRLISLVQAAAIVCVLACLIRVYSVPPLDAMEQRLFGMVTTGDFLESSQGNWLTGFANAVTFQGNSLFFETEVYLPVKNYVPDAIDVLDRRVSLVNLTGVASYSVSAISAPQFKIPLTSSAWLRKLQEYSKIERKIRAKAKEADAVRTAKKTIEAQANDALIDTVINTGFMVVDGPKEVAKFSIKNFVRAARYFGSNLMNRLMSNKLQIMIDATKGAAKYGIVMAHEKIQYQERMNKAIILVIDSILSSWLLSALLMTAAYLAESREWKKMALLWTAAERANRYYRIANVFIHSLALTLVDTGLNEGIDTLADYTGIELLRDLQVGHVAALTIINALNTTSGIKNLRDDTINGGFKLLRLVGKTAKQMLNGQKTNTIQRYKKRVEKDKTREINIMSERSTVETRLKREESRKRKRETQLEVRKRELIQQIINYQP